MTGVRVVAVDLGASSGRVFVAELGADTFALSEVARFRNGAINAGGTNYWDALRFYRGVLEGVQAAGRGGAVDSIGIDSWAVDYGLIDRAGKLLGNPVSYRDARTRGVSEVILDMVGAADLYRRTGIALQPFNTIFQLYAARNDPQMAAAETLLLLPDLLAYWLTGAVGAEQTNASTTMLLRVDGSDWDMELAAQVGIRQELLPPIRRPGERLGVLGAEVLSEVGLEAEVPVYAVGSHDTASAVAGTPATSADFAYISCGTWSLVGIELDQPVLGEPSRIANFTNERGIDGTVRYLRNVMGLWLLQQSMRTWELAGETQSIEVLLDRAAAEAPLRTLFDPDDPSFLFPGDLPSRIASQCQARHEPVPSSPSQLVRAILDSLALAYRRSVRLATELSGRSVGVVHIVGGGANNSLLCQLTADACELAVVAGPVEGAAIGNALVQARALGAVGGDRWAMRQRIARQLELRTYQPSSGSGRAWAAADSRVSP